MTESDHESPNSNNNKSSSKIVFESSQKSTDRDRGSPNRESLCSLPMQTTLSGCRESPGKTLNSPTSNKVSLLSSCHTNNNDD